MKNTWRSCGERVVCACEAPVLKSRPAGAAPPGVLCARKPPTSALTGPVKELMPKKAMPVKLPQAPAPSGDGLTHPPKFVVPVAEKVRTLPAVKLSPVDASTGLLAGATSGLPKPLFKFVPFGCDASQISDVPGMTRLLLAAQAHAAKIRASASA